MKKVLNQKSIIIVLIIFVLLFLFHLPLMIKNIITADVLLNNSYYDGYAWEISLGRFGLFLGGVLKSYLSFPHIDLIFSYVLLSITLLLLMDLFTIKEKISIGFCILLFVVSPVVSATLLFHYCNIVYFLAFFLGVSSIYLYYKWDHKYGKYVVPTLFVMGCLSFYQAYLSMIVTLFIFYNMYLILHKKVDYKKSIKYIPVLGIGVVLYFVCMKMTQVILHIDMASYSNANSIGLHTFLSIPSKIKDSYMLFYQFFFTDVIQKNTFFYNHIINILLWITFLITMGISIYKSKIKNYEKGILVLLTLLIPVFLNSVIFVISDAKLQLLMSASYLLIPIFFISLMKNQYLKIGTYLLLLVLARNYFIQDQATYMSLEHTFNQYKTIIGSAVDQNIKTLDKKYVLLGRFDKNHDPMMKNVYDRNYGYISDDGLFWDEYNLRSLGFTRFVSEYFGITVQYTDEDTYHDILNNRYGDEVIYEVDNTLVIDLDNYNKKEE